MVLLVGLGFMTLLLYLGGVYKVTGGILVPYFMLFVAFEQWAGAVTLFYPTELYPTPVRALGKDLLLKLVELHQYLAYFTFQY
ncbi:hypothetical protein [Saccharolobus islandicus]|uniref:Sugar transport related protein n=1 Tax=Saccharolobus islandicus (strain HVE10/4) TaxID=930943 RepID=F0NJA3_SACI0|nr:hypothetical protein [Sulfolobus islandicus]ADX81694.1 sugar transport related protein [Sulfolobus islandicus HVE10/4]